MILSPSNSLSQQTIANIILVSGSEDSYALIDYVVENIRNQLNTSSNYKFVADRYFKYAEINDIINSGNLFEDNSYIEINYKTKPPIDQQKEILSLLGNLNQNTYLIITTDKLNKTDSNSAWIKAIIDQGWFISINDSDTVAIIKHQLENSRIKISHDALDLLLDLNEGNSSQLMQEINKFILYFPENHEITLSDIKEHSIDNSIYNIYQLSSSYLKGDLAKSILILDNIYQKTEDAILIQWLISEDLKKLMRLKSRLRQNNNFSQAAQELKIWGTNSNLYQDAERRLTYSILVSTLDLLADLDMIIKGLINNDVKQQLINIISNLCTKKGTH